MEIAILICALVTTVAAVVALAPVFGLDLRIWGRSTLPAEVSAIPADRKKPKGVRLALSLSILSVCMSAFAAYHFFNPRILEKIIEKPIDRVVEKQVPVPCPKPKQSTSGIDVQPGERVEGNANAPNSMAAGINTGTMMQGDVSPQFSTSATRNEPKNGKFETTFTVNVTSNHIFTMQIVVTGHYIADFDALPEPAAGAFGVTSQMLGESVSSTRASGSLQNVSAGRYFVTVTTTQADNVQLHVIN